MLGELRALFELQNLPVQGSGVEGRLGQQRFSPILRGLLLLRVESRGLGLEFGEGFLEGRHARRRRVAARQ